MPRRGSDRGIGIRSVLLADQQRGSNNAGATFPHRWFPIRALLPTFPKAPMNEVYHSTPVTACSPEQPKRKTILFDIDGTILLSQRAGGRAIDRVFEMTFSQPRTEPLQLHGRTDRGILTDLFGRMGKSLNDEDFSRFINAYLRELEQNLESHPAVVLPGVAAAIEWLQNHPHAALGLLTGNVERGARIKLRSVGMEQTFAFGGFGDRHPNRDDVAREAMASAVRHLGPQFCSRSILVIGDTVHDVTCGKAIGAKVLAVETGGVDSTTLRNSGADWVCRDMAEGLAAVREFMA